MSLDSAELEIHGDISPFEKESLYSILSKTLTLSMFEPLPLDPKEQYATLIQLAFTNILEPNFFGAIGNQTWESLVGIMKNIRQRRRSHGAAFEMKRWPQFFS